MNQKRRTKLNAQSKHPTHDSSHSKAKVSPHNPKLLVKLGLTLKGRLISVSVRTLILVEFGLILVLFLVSDELVHRGLVGTEESLGFRNYLLKRRQK